MSFHTFFTTRVNKTDEARKIVTQKTLCNQRGCSVFKLHSKHSAGMKKWLKMASKLLSNYVWSTEIMPRMLCNGNGAFFHLQTEMGFFEDSCYSLYNWWKYIICPIWNLLCKNGNLMGNFSKKVIYKPLMGCSLFSNSLFQMGVTVMGFAEHFVTCVFTIQYT